VSAPFDLALLIVPALLAVAVALAIPTGSVMDPWAWLLFVVGLDVAHVWSSLYRAYLDPRERRRRPALYWGTPAACGAVLLALHALAGPWFWTAMAYLAVLHFIRQQWGFSALYRVREGLPTHDAEARIERWTLYAVTGFPILWWHAHLDRDFQWFVVGDFLPGLPPILLWPAGIATLALVLLHLRNRVRSRRFAPGRDLWLATTAAVWFGGIVLTNSDPAFTITNVVLHGLPYLALVWVVGHRQWTRHDSGPALRLWFERRGVLLFLLPLLLLAVLEEGLWDVLVWHDNAWLFGHHDPASWLSWVAVPLLAVPQVTHYVLDGFLWKLDGSNPGLRELLE